MRLRVGDCVEHFVELRRRVQRGVQRADQTRIDLFSVALEHVVEQILGNERFGYRFAAQTYARDAPAQISVRHRRVGVYRLVRAMEGAEPEMNESAVEFAPVVRRACHECRQ